MTDSHEDVLERRKKAKPDDVRPFHWRCPAGHERLIPGDEAPVGEKDSKPLWRCPACHPGWSWGQVSG